MRLDDLHQRFVENPDLSDAKFMQKFMGQLDGAAATTVQLAAELLLVYYLPVEAAKASGDHSEHRSKTSFSSRASRSQSPAALQDALDLGIADTGVAWATMRDKQLGFLIEFVRTFKALPESERDTCLHDPWVLKIYLEASG